MTIDAVRDRSKTVTRRHVDTWQTLKAGDRLTLIEKGMGLPKGATQVVLAEVEIVSVRVEPLGAIYDEMRGTDAEGLPHMSWGEFCRFWADGHGYSKSAVTHLDLMAVPCRRIEWRYIGDPFAAERARTIEHLDRQEGR